MKDPDSDAMSEHARTTLEIDVVSHRTLPRTGKKERDQFA